MSQVSVITIQKRERGVHEQSRHILFQEKIDDNEQDVLKAGPDGFCKSLEGMHGSGWTAHLVTVKTQWRLMKLI